MRFRLLLWHVFVNLEDDVRSSRPPASNKGHLALKVFTKTLKKSNKVDDAFMDFGVHFGSTLEANMLPKSHKKSFRFYEEFQALHQNYTKKETRRSGPQAALLPPFWSFQHRNPPRIHREPTEHHSRIRRRPPITRRTNYTQKKNSRWSLRKGFRPLTHAATKASRTKLGRRCYTCLD